ncbi:MAG: FlgN protein [Rhodobacteraceae bacterium HLUCCA08]|nr:MAG: FlgN protein [Rhodobacteraceae bacterium HLUCCA08]
MSQSRLVDRIERIIARERDALLSGDYASLSDLAAEKLELGDRLEALGADGTAQLKALAAALNRNERLLARAVDGVREAGDRLRQQAEARNALQTYGRDGKGSTIRTDTPRHTKRS